MAVPQKTSLVFLFLFPLFKAGCYVQLYRKRNDLQLRKRNKSAICVASLAGWFAYLTLVASLFGGLPCGMVYVASLLVAPLSMGPQIVRALAIRGKMKYSQLVVEDEISSRTQRKKSALDAIPSEMSEPGRSLPALVSASEKRMEANLVIQKTRRAVKMTQGALIIIPTILVVLALALANDASQLLATDFSQCQPEPALFRYTSPAFGIMSVILASITIILVKDMCDGWHIGDEIRRNSIILGFTYIIFIVLRFAGANEWLPLFQTMQQIVLSFSMEIVPFLPQSVLDAMSSWAQQQRRRINPATKSAVPGYARPLPKTGRPSTRTSTRNSIQNVMGRRQSLSVKQNDKRNREYTVSWDAGLCILLSTEDGINLFSQHCAREFSSENVRFWCAVNDYRAKFDEENCIPTSTDVDDEKSAKSAPQPKGDSQSDGAITFAKEMYGQFISRHSKTQTNLSSKHKKDIKSVIDSGQLRRETFDAAQREIFSVMSRDSYPRFLASKRNRQQLT